MNARPRMLLLGLLAASACGQLPEPSWQLDETRLLAVRVEVVEEGPYSVNLLPIPADRTRTDPLPQDTIELTPLIADATGILDPTDLELRWLLCPLGGPCLSLLREPEQGGPCAAVPVDSICTLEQGPRPRVRMPGLDPEHPLIAQAVPRLAIVGGLPGERTTAQCLEHLAAEPYVSLEGCLLAYSTLPLGPLTALRDAAEAEGVEVTEEFELSPSLEALGRLPNHNPEVARLVLLPLDGGTIETIARPGEVTRLPSGRQFYVADRGDPRDGQPYIGLDGPDPEQLSLSLSYESNPVQYLTPGPGWIQGFGGAMQVGEPGETSSIIVVMVEHRGGHAWAEFPLEAVAE